MFCPEKVERENNKDYNQVLLDVQRSLRRFPPGKCCFNVCSHSVYVTKSSVKLCALGMFEQNTQLSFVALVPETPSREFKAPVMIFRW